MAGLGLESQKRVAGMEMAQDAERGRDSALGLEPVSVTSDPVLMVWASDPSGQALERLSLAAWS